MPPRRRSGTIERAARKDLRALQNYGDSAMAMAYISLAKDLDLGLPARDAAAAIREMRLIFLSLQALSPPQEGEDYPDELRARREARMQGNGTE